jgi:hypothetical protein
MRNIVIAVAFAALSTINPHHVRAETLEDMQENQQIEMNQALQRQTDELERHMDSLAADADRNARYNAAIRGNLYK